MKQTEKEKTDKRSEKQAQAQFDSIKRMVERAEHCQECDGGEDCELTDEEIFKGLNICYQGEKATEEDREQYHDEDDARQAISEDPLSAEVVKEYRILLCTGGPACQIVGELNEYGEPETARLQHQDWFTPWQDHYCDEDILLDYARNFYFGE
jgi:hypothetical protein